jgi:NitT/TauT family transport system permease protein
MKTHPVSGAVSLILSVVLTCIAFTQPLQNPAVDPRLIIQGPSLLIGMILLIAALYAIWMPILLAHTSVIILLVASAAWRLLDVTAGLSEPAAGYWLLVVSLALLVQLTVQRLAASHHARLPQGAVAGLFGIWLLYFWQLLITVFAVPQVILPAPSTIVQALYDNAGLLAGDFIQTVLKSVVIGYVLGCGLGILTGILIERSSFLQRGLLPLANLTSTIPLVGVAPIAVMWFGFDWPSKAAVIVLVTFFPALVSTLAGLQSTGKWERELMYSYAASPRLTLLALRLPAALPFIFNALKVNSTLALITAIVAEYFGSPTAGLGFRISAEAARMHMPVVWAAIVVASVVGSGLYALLARLERKVTFWHPAIRGQS